jgi:membrane associated rhomboid family serine protease
MYLYVGFGLPPRFSFLVPVIDLWCILAPAGLLLICLLFLNVWELGILSERMALEHRARFFAWVMVPARCAAPTTLWCVALGIPAGLQMIGLLSGISYETVVIRFGITATALSQGDCPYWRLLPGPFIHANLAHFLVNFSTAVFFGVPAFLLLGWQCFTVFLLGNVLSSFAQISVGSDATVGISGGVLALGMYLCVGWALSRRRPSGLWLNVFLACLLNIAISSKLRARSVNTAHLVGALVGGLLGLRYAKDYFSQHLTSP